MATGKKIYEITDTATSFAADDYLPIAGVTNGTRKILATNVVTADTITGAGAAGVEVLKAETAAQVRAAAGVDDPLSGLLLRYDFNEGSGRTIAPSGYQFAGDNLFVGPNEISDFAIWNGYANVTVTDNYADDPNGGDLGTRLVFTSGAANAGFLTQAVTVNAQPYTVSCFVKSNTGAAQTISHRSDTTWGPDVTVPATGWIRSSLVFTPAAGAKNIGLIGTGSAGAAVDVTIWGAKLEAGAITPPRDNGVLCFRASPAWTTAGVNFAGGANYATGSSASLKIGSFSVYAVVKWPAANSAQSAAFCGIFGPVGSAALLSANSNSLGPMCWAGTGYGAGDPCRHGELLKDGKWHILCGTYDGAVARLYLDGDLIQYSATAVAPRVLNKLRIADEQNGSYTFPGEISTVELFATSHPKATVGARTLLIERRLSGRGVTLPAKTSYIAFDGDSITAGVGATTLKDGWNGVACRAVQATSDIAAFGSMATSSATVATLVARAATIDAALSSRAKNILFVLVGTNNIAAGTTPATTVAALKSYCLARVAAGWSVIVGTSISRTGYDTQIQEYNSLIKADASFYSAVCDFAAEPLLGATGASANATYFVDGVHPTTAGHALMGTIAAPVIAAAIAA